MLRNQLDGLLTAERVPARGSKGKLFVKVLQQRVVVSVQKSKGATLSHKACPRVAVWRVRDQVGEAEHGVGFCHETPDIGVKVDT